MYEIYKILYNHFICFSLPEKAFVITVFLFSYGYILYKLTVFIQSTLTKSYSNIVLFSLSFLFVFYLIYFILKLRHLNDAKEITDEVLYFYLLIKGFIKFSLLPFLAYNLASYSMEYLSKRKKLERKEYMEWKNYA